MRSLLISTSLVSSLLLPTIAAAQDFNVTYGATLTSRYMFNGLEQTTGAAFQPFFEGEYQGFYAGLWASNTARSIVGSSAEVDLYLGYRNEVGQFSYDLGYTRYYYQNPDFDCCGEVIFSMGFAPIDPLAVGVRFAHDPVADYVNSSVSVDYAFNDQIAAAATYGSISNGGHDYWSVGGAYAISDTFGIDLTWHDTSISSGLAVLSLTTAFNLR